MVLFSIREMFLYRNFWHEYELHEFRKSSSPLVIWPGKNMWALIYGCWYYRTCMVSIKVVCYYTLSPWETF
jgi:hypothetical protein